MTDLRQQIGNLTPAEKADLIDELWVSLEADAPSLTEAQQAELERRLATLEHDRGDGVAWERVKADLARRCP
jgi:putative addiction module component (TIGR02574 family)